VQKSVIPSQLAGGVYTVTVTEDRDLMVTLVRRSTVADSATVSKEAD